MLTSHLVLDSDNFKCVIVVAQNINIVFCFAYVFDANEVLLCNIVILYFLFYRRALLFSKWTMMWIF